MACYLHSTYNVASVKKSQREKMIFWQTFCTRRQFLPARPKWTNSTAILAFRALGRCAPLAAPIDDDRARRPAPATSNGDRLAAFRVRGVTLLERASALPMPQ